MSENYFTLLKKYQKYSIIDVTLKILRKRCLRLKKKKEELLISIIRMKILAYVALLGTCSKWAVKTAIN